MEKILVYGYGNPGRQDDGLGVLLSERIDEWRKLNHIDNVHVDSGYQLNIEDAYELNKYKTVIFVDATQEDTENFKFCPLQAVDKPGIFMHSVSPGYVIGLCDFMYSSIPDAFMLSIKGYEWNFMKGLSPGAKMHLDEAYQFLVQKIMKLIG